MCRLLSHCVLTMACRSCAWASCIGRQGRRGSWGHRGCSRWRGRSRPRSLKRSCRRRKRPLVQFNIVSRAVNLLIYQYRVIGQVKLKLQHEKPFLDVVGRPSLEEVVRVGGHHATDEVDLFEEHLHGVLVLGRTSIVCRPELRRKQKLKKSRTEVCIVNCNPSLVFVFNFIQVQVQFKDQSTLHSPVSTGSDWRS